MKKILLLPLCALAVPVAMSAQDPIIIPHSVIIGMTPDNVNAISDITGDIMFFDLESGEDPRIFTQSADATVRYATGNGNFAGNGTIGVYRGVSLGTSIYIYGASGIVNGRWISLPGGRNDADMGSANGVTVDGSRICGNAATGVEFGPDTEGTMVVPCYWDRKGNTVSSLQRLPYPAQDYAGFAPMYATAVAISDDGRTIVGQQVSSNGRLRTMVVYRQDDEGNWTYEIPFSNLINPNNIELPPYPGEGPEVPSQETFMTQAQIDKFNEAFENYQSSTNPNARPPRYEQFMSPDSIARYNAALEPYNEWVTLYNAWQDRDMQILDESTSFEFNLVDISPNGRYMATSAKTSKFDANMVETAVYTPVLYDLQQRKVILDSGADMVVASVGDNGDMVGYRTMGDIDFTYYLPFGQTEWIPIHEYIVSRRPDLKEWIDTNWKHDVWVETIDEDGEIDGHYEEMYISGRMQATRDFSRVFGTAYAFWAGAPAEIANDYVSYIVPLVNDDEGSIGEISAESPAAVSGTCYDLQGRRVVNPGRGLYISAGKKIVK